MLKFKKLHLLSALMFGTFASAQASSAPASTPITFYNNTNLEVSVDEDTFIGGMINCQGGGCVQRQSPITINPHSSGVIQLVTNVTDNKIHYGAIGFNIITDATSKNKPIIGVMATPNGAYALSNFCASGGCADPKANSESESYENDSLPAYTVSVAQNFQSNSNTAAQTVVSINPVQEQQ